MTGLASQRRSPRAFFGLVYLLSAPLWILSRVVHVGGLPDNLPITDVVATFIPMLAGALLTDFTAEEVAIGEHTVQRRCSRTGHGAKARNDTRRRRPSADTGISMVWDWRGVIRARNSTRRRTNAQPDVTVALRGVPLGRWTSYSARIEGPSSPVKYVAGVAYFFAAGAGGAGGVGVATLLNMSTMYRHLPSVPLRRTSLYFNDSVPPPILKLAVPT